MKTPFALEKDSAIGLSQEAGILFSPPDQLMFSSAR